MYDAILKPMSDETEVKHEMEFSDIESDGFFYIGIFGDGPSSSFLIDVSEVRLDEDDDIFEIEQEEICSLTVLQARAEAAVNFTLCREFNHSVDPWCGQLDRRKRCTGNGPYENTQVLSSRAVFSYYTEGCMECCMRD